MYFPKLTPLQSRFVACLGTSLLLLIIYYSFSPSHFAYAAEIDSIHNEDHNHHRIPVHSSLQVASDIDWGDDDLDAAEFEGTAQYQAEFAGVSRSIIGRALEDQFALQNNVPNSLNVRPGETKYYVFENATVWGEHAPWRKGLPTAISRGDQDMVGKRSLGEEEVVLGNDTLAKRQSGDDSVRTVFVTVNTCLQPQAQEGRTDIAPQLTLYVSQDDNNPKPGPDKGDTSQQSYPLTEGYVEAKINASRNVYISVSAPTVADGEFAGEWNYVVAASIDASYYYYNDTTPFLWTIDTDSTSALIATYNLTSENDTDDTMALRKEWMAMQVPFNMFVYNSSNPAVNGIRNSYCGMQKLDQGAVVVEGNMTERGMGSNPKQQFYIHGLQPGQKYTGLLAYNGVNRDTDSGSGVVGGGGQLWQQMEFTTKTGK
jgi:calcium channel MID1